MKCEKMKLFKFSLYLQLNNKKIALNFVLGRSNETKERKKQFSKNTFESERKKGKSDLKHENVLLLRVPYEKRFLFVSFYIFGFSLSFSFVDVPFYLALSPEQHVQKTTEIEKENENDDFRCS